MIAEAEAVKARLVQAEAAEAKVRQEEAEQQAEQQAEEERWIANRDHAIKELREAIVIAEKQGIKPEDWGADPTGAVRSRA